MPREYIVIDESGDPGVNGDPIYIVVALHMDEDTFYEVRAHLTAFRYEDGPRKEFKNSHWAKQPMKPGNGLDRLLQPIASLVEAGRVTITAVWLDKAVYLANRGPYLTGSTGDTVRFRHFQLRQLLQTHVARRRWGAEADLVIDRWRMSSSQRENLENYLRNNFALRPVPLVTLVDSIYCDIVEVVDIVSRVVRRRVTGTAEPVEQELCDRLVNITELKGGLYSFRQV